MKVVEWETVLFFTEGIRIIIRANDASDIVVHNYPKYSAIKTWSVNDLVEKRLKKFIGTNVSYAILDGNGNFADPKSKLEHLRETYNK